MLDCILQFVSHCHRRRSSMTMKIHARSLSALNLAALVVNLSLVKLVNASSFTTTGAMTTHRVYHTATLLLNGKVLVAGGRCENIGCPTFLTSAELYDPATGAWAATGTMHTDHWRHTATLLPNGQVLVAGGGTGVPSNFDAELYDPTTGTWTQTGTLNQTHSSITATLLLDGTVLVAGGNNSSAELYDPSIGLWTTINPMTQARDDPTATLLPNGEVLLTGGWGASGTLASAELYQPNSASWTGTWTLTGSMITARSLHTATLLLNGQVLVAGDAANNSTELYNPVTGNWTPTGLLPAGVRYSHTATLLSNGRVLVAGGFYGNGNYLSNAEIYNPASATWTLTSSLNTGRQYHTATLLRNGQVLVAGGYGASGSLNSAEVYTPDPGPITITGVAKLQSGAFQLSFTNTPGGTFTVLAATNASLSLSNWMALGGVTEVSPGQFKFTDSQAPNNTKRFYRVRSP